MKIVPTAVTAKAYVKDSLREIENGFSFELNNDFGAVTLTKVEPIKVDGQVWPVAAVSFVERNGQVQKAAPISKAKPYTIPKGTIQVRVQGLVVDAGPHEITLTGLARGLGRIEVAFKDTIRQASRG